MMNKEGKSQVITFVGTTPNIGTTLITLTTAVRLAERLKKKVAYLCLNLKSSKLHTYMGIDEDRASLDELLPHLRNGSFHQGMLMHAMHRYDSEQELYLLFGNRYRETAEYYGVEELTALIRSACKLYDYVFLDVNAYWDNAATISALVEADTVVVTTTTALSHFQDDYMGWIGVMGEHIQLQDKRLYCSVIKQQRGLYQPRHSFPAFNGQELPPIALPRTLYEALDRGELTMWLKQHREGRRWLSAYTAQLVSLSPETSFRKKGRNIPRSISAVVTLLFKHD